MRGKDRLKTCDLNGCAETEEVMKWENEKWLSHIYVLSKPCKITVNDLKWSQNDFHEMLYL